jgi:hypothetical protein
MLSLEQCRKVLGPAAPLSDETLTALRDQLYGLASVVIEQWEAKRPLEASARVLVPFRTRDQGQT